MKKNGLQLFISLTAMYLGLSSGHAQWLTQELKLSSGWNSVYLNVSPHGSTMTEVLNNFPRIQEIWLWRPEVSNQQFISSWDQPSASSSRWLSWKRSEGEGSNLQTLIGNAAYLVRVSESVPGNAGDYTWDVTGHPLPPSYRWTTSGMNFIGFSTPSLDAPSFESFFQMSPEGGQGIEIYEYDGSGLNPSRAAMRNSYVKRGKAVWLRRSGKKYNRYFGPYELDLPDPQKGLEFGEERGKLKIFLRNVSKKELTVSAHLIASEEDPNGQLTIEGTPPLILRGDFDATDLTYPFDAALTQDNGKLSWALKPANEDGSDVEIVLGINRAAMNGLPESFYAGILRFTDNQGQLQVDVPVSAIKESRVGLWVGEALVNRVQHNLLQDVGGDETPTDTVTALDEDLNSVEKGYVRNTTFGSVSRPFPLRLILHNDLQGDVRLLQRIFLGLRNNGEELIETILTTNEENLNLDNLDTARRITAAHLPAISTSATSESAWESLSGSLLGGGDLKFNVGLAHDNQASNPFLHTYHPDHDNKDAEFENQFGPGIESYGVNREITLSLSPAENDFESVSRGGTQILGEYYETIVFDAGQSEKMTNRVSGHFVLNRIMNLGTIISGPVRRSELNDSDPGEVVSFEGSQNP